MRTRFNISEAQGKNLPLSEDDKLRLMELIKTELPKALDDLRLEREQLAFHRRNLLTIGLATAKACSKYRKEGVMSEEINDILLPYLSSYAQRVLEQEEKIRGFYD